MRLPFVILALAACTESDQERLERLVAQTEVLCVHSTDCGIPNASTERVLSCMNDALASGARAHAVFTRLDESGFDVDTHVFTVDHRVKVFASHPGGNDFDPEPYASEVATCAGPFRLGAECWVGYTSLRWDGCP